MLNSETQTVQELSRTCRQMSVVNYRSKDISTDPHSVRVLRFMHYVNQSPHKLRSTNMCESHLQSSGIQHFGVFGEMHLHAAVLADRHRQLLQRLVAAVRTEQLVHVARRPESKNTFRLNDCFYHMLGFMFYTDS